MLFCEDIQCLLLDSCTSKSCYPVIVTEEKCWCNDPNNSLSTGSRRRLHSVLGFWCTAERQRTEGPLGVGQTSWLTIWLWTYIFHNEIVVDFFAVVIALKLNHQLTVVECHELLVWLQQHDSSKKDIHECSWSILIGCPSVSRRIDHKLISRGWIWYWEPLPRTVDVNHKAG